MRNLLIPWTKLTGDPIWNNMASKYRIPSERQYHTIDHVVQMYKYANNLNMTYDIELDMAILCHDVIYDAAGNNEIRSAYEFIQAMKNATGNAIKVDIPEKLMLPFGVIKPNVVVDHINKTIDHRPLRGQDNRIILLDLFGFAIEKDRLSNYKNLLLELQGLYPDVDILDIKYNMRTVLIRICTNIVEFTVSNEDDEYYNQWIDIQNGMAAQISLIESELVAEVEKREKRK